MTTDLTKKKTTFKTRSADMSERMRALVEQKTGQSAATIIARPTIAESNGKAVAPSAPAVPPTETPAPGSAPRSTTAAPVPAVAPTLAPAASEGGNGGGGGNPPLAAKPKKDKAPKAEIKALGKHMTFFLYDPDIAKLQAFFVASAQQGHTLNMSQLMRLVLRAAPENILTPSRIAEIKAEDGRRAR